MSYNHYENKTFTYSIRDNDKQYGVLKFSFCDNEYPLFKLSKDELKAFVNFAKKFESLSWQDIKKYVGFKFENISNIKNRVRIENSYMFNSLRVSQKFRLIGFRKENAFNIIWFDKNHEVY